jgi:hypothetical protein
VTVQTPVVYPGVRVVFTAVLFRWFLDRIIRLHRDWIFKAPA